MKSQIMILDGGLVNMDMNTAKKLNDVNINDVASVTVLNDSKADKKNTEHFTIRDLLEKPLLTVKQANKLLSVGNDSLYKLASVYEADGLILRVGSGKNAKILFRTEKLLRLISELDNI